MFVLNILLVKLNKNKNKNYNDFSQICKLTNQPI